VKLRHVPTVPELVDLGLAVLSDDGEATKVKRYRVKKKGQAMIDSAMLHNAAILKPLVDDVEAKRAAYLKAQRKLAKIASAPSTPTE
jgi:hypothetical protein